MAVRGRTTRFAVAIGALLWPAFLWTGCAAAGPPTPPSSDYYGLDTHATGGSLDSGPALGADSGIVVDEPVEGAAVESPVAVSGTVAGPHVGERLAAQVFSIEADGSTRWRGNATLQMDPDGRYSGAIPYSLDGASEGILEIVAVSYSGEPRARIRVSLNLMPAGITDGGAP